MFLGCIEYILQVRNTVQFWMFLSYLGRNLTSVSRVLVTGRFHLRTSWAQTIEEWVSLEPYRLVDAKLIIESDHNYCRAMVGTRSRERVAPTASCTRTGNASDS